MKQNIESCEKCPNTEFFPGLFFPVFSPNAGKYAPEKARYLETFHAVLLTVFNKYFKPEPYLMDSISSSIYLFIYLFFLNVRFTYLEVLAFIKLALIEALSNGLFSNLVLMSINGLNIFLQDFVSLVQRRSWIFTFCSIFT